MTVKDNLEVAGLALKDRKLFQMRYEEVLELFSVLKNLLKRLPMKLSGGERQLLAFALASLHKPKIILADEPFAGLSHGNIETIKHQVQMLNHEHNITFLIVEHRVKESYEIANRIIGLKIGKVYVEYQTIIEFDLNKLKKIFI